MQLRNEALKKIHDFNPWPRDTGAILYQLSYEATCWEQVNCGFIGSREKNECSWYMKNYIWTSEMKWKWNENEMVVAVNAIYAIA